MDESDPYFCMQHEVIKTLKQAKSIYNGLESDSNVYNDNTTSLTQLCKVIKGIEWDLMDLEETITAVEKKPSRFQLSNKDISDRRQFLLESRNIIKSVKNQVNTSTLSKKVIDFTVHPALPSDPLSSLSNGNLKTLDSNGKEFTLKTVSPLPKRSNLYVVSDNPISEQKQLLRDQNDRLDQLGASISTLKGMSYRIGDELGDQVMLLDDFSGDMARTESKLDRATKRTARLLRLSTDRRQWCAIFSLLSVLIIILILLVIL